MDLLTASYYQRSDAAGLVHSEQSVVVACGAANLSDGPSSLWVSLGDCLLLVMGFRKAEHGEAPDAADSV